MTPNNTPNNTPERDPNGLAPSASGAKLDAGKPQTWLMLQGFAHALEQIAHVTTQGANKYSPGGWTQVENGAERYMQAFARHLLALGQGHTHDNGPGGTGCLHKAQAIWNLLASLELELRAKPPSGGAQIHTPDAHRIHISVDIETMGLRPGAPILEIGAWAFIPATGETHGHFYECIGLSGNSHEWQENTEWDTIQWWRTQSDCQRLLNPRRASGATLQDTLALFARWLRNFPDTPLLWMRSPQFDAAHLEHAYREFHGDDSIPWEYHQLRDVRTACALALPELPPRTTAQHHALHDAIYQAECIQAIYKQPHQHQPEERSCPHPDKTDAPTATPPTPPTTPRHP